MSINRASLVGLSVPTSMPVNCTVMLSHSNVLTGKTCANWFCLAACAISLARSDPSPCSSKFVGICRRLRTRSSTAVSPVGKLSGLLRSRIQMIMAATPRALPSPNSKRQTTTSSSAWGLRPKSYYTS